MVQGHAILVEQNELSQVEFQTVTSAESTGMHVRQLVGIQNKLLHTFD